MTGCTRLAALPAALVLTCLVAAPVLARDDAARLTLDERAELVELLERAQAETLRLVKDVDDELWSRKPAPDRWSVGEVVEHLVLAEGAIRGTVASMQAGEVDPEWRQVDATPIAQLLAIGADRSRKFTASERVTPQGGMTRDEALSRLLAARAATVRYVLETDEPIKSYTSMTPAGVAATGRIWLAFLAAHNLRHNAQIEEVLAALDP